MSRNKRSFGKYRLIGLMASGGMARLFLAVMKGVDGFERVTLVKRVLPHLAESKDFMRMFLNEARLAAKLDHPNIVRIYELGEEEGQHYISMEYLPGEDLTKLLRQSRKQRQWIPIPIATTIVQNVAEALHTAHTLTDDDHKPMGIVHRDISPGNVLLTYYGSTKLADFGIAKATQALDTEGTRAGMFKGKYAYASPEQVLGKPLDARTDIFALGIVFWELLTSRRLFKRANEMATIRAVDEAEIPSIRAIRPDVPQEIEDVVNRALARKRKDRFQSAMELSDALDEVLSSVVARPSPKKIAKWVTALVGKEKADLKKSIAQGRGLEDDPTKELPFSEEQRELLGIKPIPDDESAIKGRKPGTVGSKHKDSSTPGEDSKSSGSLGEMSSRPSSKSEGRELSFLRATSTTGAKWAQFGSSGSESQISFASQASLSEQPFSESPASWSEASVVSSGTYVSDFSKVSKLSPTKSKVPLLIGGSILALFVAGSGVWMLTSGDASPPRAEAQQEVLAVGELGLRSKPSEASVIVDGEDTGFLTDALLPDMRAGKLRVRLELEGYQSSEFTVEVPEGGRVDKFIRLRAER